MEDRGRTHRGATNATYTTPPTVAGDDGSTFDVVVTNGIGSATSTPVATLTVNTAPLPTITLTATPAAIMEGETSTLDWSAQNATSVDIDGGVGSVSATAGTVVVSPTETTTYTASAVGPGGGPVTASAIVEVTAAPTTPFAPPPEGGASFSASGSSSPTPGIGHVQVLNDPGDPAPTGLAFIALEDSMGDVLAITTVPAVQSTTTGIFGAEVGSPAVLPIQAGEGAIAAVTEEGTTVNTGVALSNENPQDALISFYFTDTAGTQFGHSSFTLAANQQISVFLNEPPFNAPSPFLGTFAFESSVPIGAIALRGVTNSRNEFLFATVPVGGEASTLLPLFTIGGGWNTEIHLTNDSASAKDGRILFYGEGSRSQITPAAQVTVDGVSGSVFDYAIPPFSTARVTVTSPSSTTRIGSMRILPTLSSPFIKPPKSLAILSLRNNGIRVSETSVAPSGLRNAYRIYVESSGEPGAANSVRSGLAIANGQPESIIVNLDLVDLDGTELGVTGSVEVPPNGLASRFIDELVPGVPSEFKGIVRLTAPDSFGVVALLGQTNQRGDFLMAATPPLNEGTGSGTTLVFPHVVSGGGFTTELLVFGQGRLVYRDQDGMAQDSALEPVP